MERVLSFATRFLEEVRADISRAKMDGTDTPPRLRSVHERPGHATPEFRTLNIPAPDGMELSPDVLSAVIARYAAPKRPDCLILAFEAELDGRPVLISEARCKFGTRLFWMQPFTLEATHVEWDEPLHEGWRDPGDEEMILDASFARVAVPTARVVQAQKARR